MTRTSSRGVRVGEARKPGPASPPFLKLWSINCRSFRKNGFMLLDEAKARGAQMVALQETNLTAQQTISVDHTCRLKGWQLLHVPLPSFGTNRGGVALAVQLPFAISIVSQDSVALGQTLICSVEGQQRVFKLVVHYRHHTDRDHVGFFKIFDYLDKENSNSWICAFDSNLDLDSDPLFDNFTTVGSTRTSVARHTTGSHPIDAVYTSADLGCRAKAKELPCLGGDHTIAQACFNLKVDKCGRPTLRFAKPRPVCSPNGLPLAAWSEIATSEASWSTILKDPDLAFKTWAGDVEMWMVGSGLLDGGTPEKDLASPPKLVSGAHRMGHLQPLEERQLRRIIRRLEEAHFLQLRGRLAPPSLCRNLQRCGLLAQDELDAVRNGAWGQAVLLVKKRLDQIQTNCRNRRLSEWNKYVHTIPGACRWVQRESPPPMVLENSGKVVTSHGEAAEVLHSAWGEVFGCNTPLV